MELLAGAAADGVDQDVDPPEALDRVSRDHALGIGLVGRVGDDGQALATGGLDPRDGGVERVLGPAADDDLRAGPGEGLGQRRADGAAAARDDGHEAIQPEVVECAHRAPSLVLIDYRA